MELLADDFRVKEGFGFDHGPGLRCLRWPGGPVWGREGRLSDAVAQKGHLADQQVCASAAHDEKSRNDAPR